MQVLHEKNGLHGCQLQGSRSQKPVSVCCPALAQRGHVGQEMSKQPALGISPRKKIPTKTHTGWSTIQTDPKAQDLHI